MALLQHFCSFLASVCLILGFLPFTSAGKHTVPLQKVVDYYTYRSAVAAFGPDQTKILGAYVGKGTHKDGGANFLEFENFVSPEKKKILTVADYTAAGITDLDNPEVYAVSDFVKSKGKSTITRVEALFGDPKMEFKKVIKNTRGVLEKGKYSYIRSLSLNYFWL
jgi:hypothetical protein